MRIIDAVHELGLPLQVNTTISRLTLPHFPAMVRRVSELPLVLWAVFFLIKTGRGAALDQIDAHECEDVLERLHELSLTAPFGIKTTEAPHYHRVIRQRHMDPFGSRRPGSVQPESGDPSAAKRDRWQRVRVRRPSRSHLPERVSAARLRQRAARLARPRLPSTSSSWDCATRMRSKASAGAVRSAASAADRARAYEATGSAFGSDPLCAYEPDHAACPGWTGC